MRKGLNRFVVLICAKPEWYTTTDYYGADVQLGAFPWFTTEIPVSGRSVPVPFVHSGSGKVAAAAATQFAVDKWGPTLVVNLGTCGGFEGSELKEGNIILVRRTAIYDVIERSGGQQEMEDRFTTELQYPWLRPPYPACARPGVIASADQDVDPERVESLRQSFDAIAGDWESGAIAYVAKTINKTDCLIVRTVSDVVGASGSPICGTRDENGQQFEKRVRKVFPALLDSLPEWLERTGICGRPLTASKSRSKSGKLYAYYHCYGNGCGSVRVSAAKMEELYEELLTGISHRVSPVLKLLREVVMDWWSQQQEENVAAQARIDSRIQKLETKKSRLVDAFLDEKIDQETFMDKKSEIQAQICLSKCEKHDEQLESRDIEAALASAEHVLEDAWNLWRRLPLAEKKRLNDLLFPEGIECTKNGRLRTPSTNAAIEVCDRLAAGDSPMAPPRGIEPLFPG